MKNILIILLALILFSCEEEFKQGPFGVKNENDPNPVESAAVIENIPGGAIIQYKLPSDVDIQYVKAIYRDSKGIESEVRASAFVSKLKIEGLGDTKERTVRIYAVNKAERVSSPVEVTIAPLTPPIVTTFESLKYKVGFGGFVVDFENEGINEISLNILYKDSLSNKMEYYESMYTSQQNGKYAVRGLPSYENKFGVYVRDRWENSSDTLYFTVTPWPEVLLNKKSFKPMNLKGDVTWSGFAGSPNFAFNDILTITDYAHTEFPIAFPHRYSLDLGVNAKISRFKFFQRPGDKILYEHGNAKHYKVYARADNPSTGNADNVMEGWTQVLDCHSFKPSGFPMGQNSQEDIEYAAAGEEFEFPLDLGPVRYIRFEFLESWSGMECTVIGEFTFWGEIIN